MTRARSIRREPKTTRIAQHFNRALIPLLLVTNLGSYGLSLYLMQNGPASASPRTDAWQLVTVSALVSFQAVWLVWLRQQPVSTVIGSLVLWQAAVLVGGWEALAVQPGLLFALFVFATERGGIRRWMLAFAGLLSTFAVLVLAYVQQRRPGEPEWDAPAVLLLWALASSLVVLVPTLAGAWYSSLRDRAERIAELALKASSSEAVRTAQAVAAERRTLAQEIHDTSSAHLAALLALSSAAESTAMAAGDAHSALITQIRFEGERLYHGFERMLTSMLQEDRTATESHQPGVRPGQHCVFDLIELVDEHRRATHSDVVLHHSPALEEIDRRLGPMRSHIAYRVVQEALSNARKHAANADVTITVEDDFSELLLRIENTAPPRGADHEAATRSPSLGYGLEGMRDRLLAAGGSLRTGPRQNGGWSVNALLPHPPHQVTRRRSRSESAGLDDSRTPTDDLATKGVHV